jgi:hypothetical protein
MSPVVVRGVRRVSLWGGNREKAGGRIHRVRDGLLCAAIVALCWWVSHPVAEMAFMDDWAYAKTAQVFAQTGHFVYNGWNSQILGWQVVWGALFIKLFGFSFFVLRLSTLFVATATVFLFHSILIRFGVNAKNAVLGTFTLGLSPLAASYMTDVPALFVICCVFIFARGQWPRGMTLRRSDGFAWRRLRM